MYEWYQVTRWYHAVVLQFGHDGLLFSMMIQLFILKHIEEYSTLLYSTSYSGP